MMAKRRVRVHTFVEDGAAAVNYRGEKTCVECFLPKRNRIHDLPEQHADVAKAEARRLGERETRNE